MSNTASFLEVEAAYDLWQAEIAGVKLWPALRDNVKRRLDWRTESWEHRQSPRAWRTVHPKLWKKHGKTLRFFASPARATDF